LRLLVEKITLAGILSFIIDFEKYNICEQVAEA
jgi:hypothetical protein